MSSGDMTLGTRLLDVLSPSCNEVASFGNKQGNTLLRIYDSNLPLSTGYIMGLSNNSFIVAKSSSVEATSVGIGTIAPLPGATLHVQGTLATSNIVPYPPNSTLTFGNASLGGICNLAITGNITVNNVPFGSGQWDGITGGIITTCNIGIGTKDPRAKLDVTGVALFSSNVGIGTTVATSNLTVQGDAVVSGQLVVGQLIDKSGANGAYSSWSLYGGENTKTVLTNDTTAINRILFSFALRPGQYILNGNLPFKNLTSFVSIDNFNWVTVGIYQCTPATFNDSLTPVFTVPLVAIGGDANEFDTCSINTLLVPTNGTATDYVIAVTGRGHQLQFGGTGMPTPVVYTVPTRGIGMNDNIAVRQALQVNCFRGSFTSTEGQTTFTVDGTGVFDVSGSNVDVYINGIKYVWRSGAGSDFTLATSTVNNNNVYTVTLAYPLSAGNAVDIVVWPNAVATDYFSSGYLYQNINYYSANWLQVAGGGVRTGDRLVVDGDLYVGGNIHFGCNTTTFESGAQWSGDRTSITSNIIGSVNIVDGAITGPKIVDGAVSTLKIADNAVTSAKIGVGAVTGTSIASGAVTVDKLNLVNANVGFGTATPRSRVDVIGTVTASDGYVATSSNANLTYNFAQSSVAAAPLVSFQTSNMSLGSGISPVVRLEAKDATVSGGTLVTSWSGWSVSANVLRSTYGYLGGLSVELDGSGKVITPPVSGITMNISGGGGFTAFVLCRFTAANSPQIFVLNTGSGTSIVLRRDSTTSSSLTVQYTANSVLQTVTATGAITQGEWAVYAVTISAIANGYINIYKNGKLLISQLSTQTLSAPSYTFTSALSGLNLGTGNMAMGAVMMFSKVLNAEEFASVNNYIMSGEPGFAARSTPLLQTNPVVYTTSGDTANGSTQNVDVNANLRIHALPADPMWAFDSYSSDATFANSNVTDLPTFTRTNNGGVVFSSGKYLALPSAYVRCGTQGFTYMMEIRPGGITSSSNSLLYMGQDPSPVGSTKPYINLTYRTGSDGFAMTLYNSNLNNNQTSFDSTPVIFSGGQDVMTVVVRYDPGNRGQGSFWINGNPTTITGALFSGTFTPLQDQFFPYITVNNAANTTGAFTIYSAAFYDRALSDTEIRQAHTVMMSDTTYAPVEIGGRSGRTALAVSKEGYITPFTMSPDNIPGLIGYLPFDNHAFDATSGINWISTPQITGSIQFNRRGRVGSSLVLINNEAGTVSNWIQYPFTYPLVSSSGMTVSVWIKYYYRINNSTMCFLTFAGTSFPDPISVSLRINSTSNLLMSYQDQAAVYTTYTNTNITLMPNTWYHAALSITTTNINLYVNAQQLSITGLSITPMVMHSLILGQRFGQNNQGVNGEIDDLRIYNRVLSIDEVRALAAGPASPSSMRFNSAGTGNPIMNVNTGAVQMAGPLQLSATTTLDYTVTNNSNQASTVSMSTQSFQFQDLSGLQSNISLPQGVFTSNNGPFSYEGSLNFTGGFLSFSDTRYSFTWWQNNGFTAETWVNYNNFTSAINPAVQCPMLFGLMNVTQNNNFWTFGANSSGNLQFFYWNGGAQYVTSTSTLSANTWHHIAVSCDATNIRLYLNGQIVQTAAVQGTPQLPSAVPCPFTICASHNGSSVITLRDVAIAGLRLVQGASLYNATTLPNISAPPALSTSGTNMMLLRNSLNLQTPMSITSAGDMTLSGNISAGNLGMFRNRIINGDMRIDQRNNGVAINNITSVNGYSVDRFKYNLVNSGTWTVQRVVDAPSGFNYSLRIGVSSSVASYETNSVFTLNQRIEGYNLADFNLGTLNASPFVVSFWAKSTVIGTYGFSIDNGFNSTAGYTTTYTINQANTWERKVIYIPPATVGTWDITNNQSMRVMFCLAYGTDFSTTTINTWRTSTDKFATSSCIQLSSSTYTNASLNITGVQLEKGTIATPFEYRPYPTELALCQRYCIRMGGGIGSVPRWCIGMVVSTGSARFVLPYPVTMYTSLSTSSQFTTSGTFNIGLGSGTTTLTAYNDSTPNALAFDASGLSGLTIGQAVLLSATTNTAYLQVDVDF